MISLQNSITLHKPCMHGRGLNPPHTSNGPRCCKRMQAWVHHCAATMVVTPPPPVPGSAACSSCNPTHKQWTALYTHASAEAPLQCHTSGHLTSSRSLIRSYACSSCSLTSTSSSIWACASSSWVLRLSTSSLLDAWAREMACSRRHTQGRNMSSLHALACRPPCWGRTHRHMQRGNMSSLHA
jgi:hypothetical protein